MTYAKKFIGFSSRKAQTSQIKRLIWYEIYMKAVCNILFLHIVKHIYFFVFLAAVCLPSGHFEVVFCVSSVLPQ